MQQSSAKSVVDSWISSSDSEQEHNKTRHQDVVNKIFTSQQQVPGKHHQNRRMGLQADKLSTETLKQQQKNRIDKINSDLKFQILKKHDVRKRKKRKGEIIDYGEEEEETQQTNASSSSTNNDITNQHSSLKRKNVDQKNSEDDEGETKLKHITKKKKLKKKKKYD
ncbi:hypothetical protein FDP41_009003 [Naegleria fowleri]|uniref:Uncharacterized protein n=1 Tax=Naegleria fowleri TaxID=5763 RepID=A0A6A5BFE0_NAEFO|nr:uncharacterized protein FDP41_009003 [Naegleria fowleri]KAF0972754.1 hypothetical protein FDP41_009003 [Naegleria fowleri]CAG4713959.1 unnamed protein product [Naegleria fowleri]